MAPPNIFGPAAALQGNSLVLGVDWKRFADRRNTLVRTAEWFVHTGNDIEFTDNAVDRHVVKARVQFNRSGHQCVGVRVTLQNGRQEAALIQVYVEPFE